MTTCEISGRLWAVVRADDSSKALLLRHVPNPFPFPDALYPEVWAALGYGVRVTVDQTWTVQGFERER